MTQPVTSAAARPWFMHAVPVAIGMLVGFGAPAFAECRPAELVSPPPGSRITDPQPELRWSAVRGAITYRLQLQARTPEGGIGWSVDTAVAGNAYRIPRPITRSMAAVKVLVTAGCETLTQQDLQAQPALFYVDVTDHCPVPTPVGFDPGSRVVNWDASAIRRSIEVAAYRTSDGHLLEKHTVSAANRVQLKAKEAAIVALRASCAEADGQVYLLAVPGAAPATFATGSGAAN